MLSLLMARERPAHICRRLFARHLSRCSISAGNISALKHRVLRGRHQQTAMVLALQHRSASAASKMAALAWRRHASRLAAALLLRRWNCCIIMYRFASRHARCIMAHCKTPASCARMLLPAIAAHRGSITRAAQRRDLRAYQALLRGGRGVICLPIMCRSYQIAHGALLASGALATAQRRPKAGLSVMDASALRACRAAYAPHAAAAPLPHLAISPRAPRQRWLSASGVARQAARTSALRCLAAQRCGE